MDLSSEGLKNQSVAENTCGAEFTMTVEYKIIESQKLVYVRMNGVVIFSELMAHIRELSRDHKYRSPMKKLVDFRYCSQYVISIEEGIRFAMAKAHLCDVFDNEKCALVAPKDIEYGMGRVHEVHTSESSIETNVFREFDEAMDWLKITINDDAFDFEKG
jgi:hypothetical protein